MDGLQGIRQSQTNPKYLHTNSTSHKWPFSAVAELIDNAYDPDVCAAKLDINYESFVNHPCLTFTDNGNGLDAEGMHKMLSFGFSHKQDTPKHLAVGQYGNGFKSGSMRLGRDAIVFSNRKNTKTIGFLSQTFLETIKAETVLVPIVSWGLMDNQMIQSEDAEPSLRAILQHSIFKTREELFEQFKKIGNHKGTRIIIYNLKRDASNRLEFDLMRDDRDIIIAEEYESTHPAYNTIGQQDSDIPEHTYSLRAYCSILFMKPKLRIHLRGRKVQTLFVEKSLSRTERDTYKPKNVKLNPDKPVKITFGFNPKKNQYGILMYHRNRLIKPNVKVGHQTKPDNRGVGVLGVVECNFLQPTHNKQDFLDTNVYRSLIQALGNKLNDYWNEKMGVTHNVDGFNMVKPEPADQPDDNWVQCDRCQKWRKLPPNINMAAVKRLKEWFCEMNPDPDHSKCNIPEEPEDPDEVRPSYDKTYKRRQQAAEYQRRAIEEARRRQERSKINEEKKKMREEKARLEMMQKELALQREAKKQMEMERLLQKIAVQQEQIKAQEQQIQQAISKAGTSVQNNPAYDDDDDEIQIVEDDEPEPPPASQGQPGPIPLKITKVNQGSLKRPEPPMSQLVVPAKRPCPPPNMNQPRHLPPQVIRSAPSTPRFNVKRSPSSGSQSPRTPGSSPSGTPASGFKLRLKLNSTIKVKPRSVHKRIQVDEEQSEALESEDESDSRDKSKFKVMSSKNNMSHSGTQVNEADLSGCCWVCRQMKIKQEIKQEVKQEYGEEGASVKVKQVHLTVKHEPGLSLDSDHQPDSLNDIPSTSKASPSKTVPNASGYLQRRFEIVTKERNSLKQELEKLKEHQSKQDEGPSVSQLSEKLEESWQKGEDLGSELEKVSSERTVLQQEVGLLRKSAAGDKGGALSQSLAQLAAMTRERDLLREGKADLERRVNEFTKTLSQKLDVQSRQIQEEFNSKLRDARERAASAEVRASSLLEEKELLMVEIAKLNSLMTEENKNEKKVQEEATKKLKECEQKVQAVIEAECLKFQERENVMKVRLAETLRHKEELTRKLQNSQEHIMEVEKKLKDLEEWKAKTSKELKDAKDKEDKAVKALEEASQKHADRVKQVETVGNRRLEECREQLQVMVKEMRQQFQDKQQDLTRKLAASQQEVSDAQNKWEDSEKKVQEKDAELQALRQQAAGGDQANALLVNLRSNVFHLLRTLINQEVDLDTLVTDPRSSQVDDIVQQVLDDNSQ